MAFALPSFNAAVASANTAGAPVQRLQANIEFDDVKSDIATKYMTKLPLEKFLTEANIAKQALSEYGAGLRNKMTLDHNMKISEMREKQDKRNALVNMLTGSGDSNAGMQLQQLLDPRTEYERQMQFIRNKRVSEQNAMGALHPSLGLNAAMTELSEVKAPGTNATYQQVKKTEQEAQPISIPLAQTSNTFNAIDLLKVYEQQRKQANSK